jgi:hypothetical protein
VRKIKNEGSSAIVLTTTVMDHMQLESIQKPVNEFFYKGKNKVERNVLNS